MRLDELFPRERLASMGEYMKSFAAQFGIAITRRQVFAYDPGQGQFLPLDGTAPPPIPAPAVLQCAHAM